MTKFAVQPTGNERSFGVDEIIVSKTDAVGHLLYVNDVFCRIGLYKESELIGKPHSVIRHPDMPRCVFKLLWDTVQGGHEIFAYVKNLAKNGDHYWVLAHVTPTFDSNDKIVGYHSNRRVPDRSAIVAVEPIYHKLLTEERRHADRKDGMLAAHKMLLDYLRERNLEYDRFIFSTIQSAA